MSEAEDKKSILDELAALLSGDLPDPEVQCSFLDGLVAPWVTVVDVQCPHSPYPVCVQHADFMKSKIGYVGYCSQCSTKQKVQSVERR